MVKKSILFSMMCLFIRHISLCQEPIIKVDINVPERQESEVNEPDYFPWPLDLSKRSIVYEDVIFRISGSYLTEWFKTGTQSPYYARLVSDGVRSESCLKLTFSGLPNGKHTLLTFHNTYSNPATNTFCPVDIYLNSVLKYDNFVPTNRALSNNEAATAFFEFEVANGEDVILKIYPDTNSTANNIIATLCGFELNTPNAEGQAQSYFPKNRDEHAPTTNNELTLRWKPADSVESHNVYFGENYLSIFKATVDSGSFVGNMTDTTLLVKDLYSMRKYYWRVDEIDSAGVITKGDVWYFKPAQLAFPGAEGYGRYAIGGRGGRVIEVTNLDDSGPGSLRDAIVNHSGPRTIVFKVSGIINLDSRITINKDYITIAGQTAPGKGICIIQAPIGLSGASDIIMRHLRVRLGSGTTYDGMGMAGSDFSILDHCSISWTIDEAFSSRSAKNISLQRTLISEALNVANHQNYPAGSMHGYAGSISGDIGSFHHNLLAHCAARNWSLAGGLDGNGDFSGRLDIFNNVVYNWYSRVTEGGAHEVNFVNNYYKPGPASKAEIDHALMAEYEEFPGTQRYYFNGNVMPGVFDESNQSKGRIYTGEPQGYSPWVDSPFFPSYAHIHSANDAYKHVLSDVGARQPVFDDHDKRIIQETLDGSYTYQGSYTNLPGIPDSDEDAGSWEKYPEYQRAANWDTDHDGMPDWWETANGLNSQSTYEDFTESNSDPDKNGYTALEEYLNWMAEEHFFIHKDSVLFIDLKDYSRGFTNEPVFSISDLINGSINQVDNSSEIEFEPIDDGFASFSFQVTDKVGSSMNKTLHFFVGNVPKDTLYVPEHKPTKPTDTVTFTKNNTIQTVHLYPTIASEFIYLDFDDKNLSDIDLEVVDTYGRKIKSEVANYPIATSYTLFVGDLSPGVYFINISKNNECLHTLKFIKY
jgi:hypothetical protein